MRDDSRQSLALEVLRKHGEIRIAALGLSMLPTLWPGDILTIRTVSVSECKPEDVVLYERKGRLVIHRIVRHRFARGERFLITRGDAISHEDNPVPAGHLLGRVTAVERGGRSAPVASLSRPTRLAGLVLGSSARLRSLALRVHRRSRATSELNSLQSVHGSI
jgi:signal peptidase I